MKNVIIMLAVIAMAAPLYAADPCDVVFAGDGSTGSLVLSYTTNNGALPRGIGLKCEVLAGDTVDVDSDAVVADPCFNTFIDYAFMDPDNFVIGAGHPMADPCYAGVLDPCTGVDVFSICMGALDQTGNQNAGPATSTMLVGVPLTSTAGSVTIRISEDILRGGVVGSALTTNLPIDVVVSFVTECYVVGQPRYYDENMNPGPAITQANYDAWVAAGKSLCWCCPHHGYGDVNGDGFINFQDYNPIIGHPGEPAVNEPRADVNHDGFINFQDYNPIIANPGLTLPNTCPDCP
ncbi:MAG: hypothetical protein KAJ52_01640 [Sedimentisphaerales bacterium]|nr:hypothetical protein [Sedimentisphaerales bacterium]